jgi:hypothetical protein
MRGRVGHRRVWGCHMCQFDSIHAHVPVFLSTYLYFLHAHMEGSQVFTDKHKSTSAADKFSLCCTM